MNRFIITTSIFGLLAVQSGCKSSGDKSCPHGAAPTVTAPAPTPAPQDENWCRVCVRSPQGYFSCQRAAGPENRDALLVKARALACQDAQWSPDNCPDAAIFMSRCKGDPGPAEKAINPNVPISPLPLNSVLPEIQKRMNATPEPSAPEKPAAPGSSHAVPSPAGKEPVPIR